MNIPPSVLGAAWAIARKDFVVEFRTRTAFIAAVMFAIIGIAVLWFALSENVKAPDVAPGVLWVIFVFSGILAVQRSFGLEQVDRAIDGLLLAPIDREAVFLGKAISNIVFVGAIQCVSVPAVALFYQLEFNQTLLVVLGIAVLAAIGLAAVGTLFSAMAVNTHMAELLLPLLSLPFFLPIVAPAARLTATALAGRPIMDSAFELQMLVAFDIVFLTAGTMAYPFTIEE